MALNLKNLSEELKKRLQQGVSNVGNFAKQSAQLLPPVQAYNAVKQMATPQFRQQVQQIPQQISNFANQSIQNTPVNRFDRALPQIKSNIQGNLKALSDPNTSREWANGFSDNLGGNIAKGFFNNWVAPAAQIPYQARQLMNKDNTGFDRGMAGLQLGGNILSTAFPGIEDVAWAGIQGVKNYNKSSLAGGNLKQNLTSFKKGATGEEFAGLGDAFLAGDSAARDILNMAELPVALLMGASIKNGQNVGFDKGTVEKFKNALQDPETRTLVQDFANMVENAKNPNRMNPSITEDGVLKDLGNRMQLMADDLFGRKTGTLSNTQLKNLFDILYQQAGDASRFNIKKIQLGASTQNIREGIDAQAGVTDAVNPLIQEAKKYGSADANPIVNQKTGETLNQAIERLRDFNWPEKDIVRYKNAILGIEEPISKVKPVANFDVKSKAIKEYGTTNVPESAAFVTPEGKIIDSSGRKQGSMSEGRNIDHREIAVNSIPDNSTTNGMSGSDALSYFMKESGSTRVSVMPKEINIDTLNPLTDVQLKQLEKLANGRSIVADISRPDGSVAKSGVFNSFNEYKTWIKSNLPGQPKNQMFEDFMLGKINDLMPNNPINQSKGVTKGVESMPVGQKERGFVTSVQEAPKIIGKVKAKVKGIYTPKPNTDLMGEAQALLQDGATIDFKNVQGVDKKVAATIQEALNAQKAGNHQAAANLFNNLAEQGTELGRGVQAFSLLQKMSPEAVSLSVAGKIKKYNQTAMRQIPELTGEQQKVIADQITALDLLKGREKNIALNELQNTINSFIPSSIGDKAIAVWKAGLLTSFRTHERNFLGNLIHGGLEVAKDVPASIADIGLSAVTGQRTKSFTTKGIREFATKDTGQQMKDIISRGYDPSETINKFDYKTITWGNNPVEQALKKYTDVVFRTLGASDKPFYNAALSRSLYDQATTAAINAGKRGNKAFIENLVKNPTEDILKIAIGDANVATFKNKNAATAISSAIKNALKSEKFGPIGSEIGKVVGEITMPFTGVPSSILGQIINYSPAGLLKGIINTGRVALTHVPNLQRQAVEELGRGIIGTGIFGLGAYLASKGLITGQPKDATEQRLWDTQNKPRNSIMLFGKWRSLNSIGPEAVVFLAGAKAQEEMKNPEGSAANYALSLGKDYLDQSFVQGIKAPINALTDPSRYAKSYAGQTISSVIPNLVKDAGKAFDPYMREANTVMDYAKSSTPILRNTMLPSRDVLGRPRTQEPTGIGAFIDVFNSKTPITNDVVNELERLYTTGNNATPGKLNKSQTIGGVKQNLTPAELDQLESTVGEEGRVQLQSLINNSGYQTLSDEDKANAISSLLTGIRKKTRATIKLSPTATDNSVPTATASDTTNKTYILVNQETGTVKQVDLYSPIEYPTLTGITSVDKKLISGYKSDISSRLGDAIKLYDNGKGQITLEQLKDVADQTDNQLAKAKGPKKPKKITIKYTAYKPQKITIKRSSARVNPTIKKPKKLKSTRKYTIKLK